MAHARALRFLLLGLLALIVVAAPAGAEPDPVVRVTVREAPPFVWRDVNDEWAGLAVDLWRRVADEAGLRLAAYEERNLKDLLEAVASGKADVGLGAISVTAEREQRLDFSHPFFTTGIGVAQAPGGSPRSSWQHLETLFARGLGWLLGGLLLGLLVFAFLITWTERRANPAFREVDRRKATGVGLWWAVVLALGNKSIFPQTTLGRVLALGMMGASVLLLSVFVGAVASVLTVSQLEAGVESPEDLRRCRVATVSGTTSAEFLASELVPYQEQETLDEALDLLATGLVDAVVYDRPLLLHVAQGRRQGEIQVLPVVFDAQDYAFALSPESEIREVVNRALLKIRGTRWWREQRFLRLGE